MPHKINPIDFENCEGKYLILLKKLKEIWDYLML